VVLWAFVLGPLLSNLPVPAYFSAHRPDNPYAYAAYTASFADMGRLLPGVFEHNPIIPKVVNSSLWTIPVEATMYLYVGAAGSLRLLRLRVLTSAILAVGLVVVVAWTLATGRGTEVPLGLLVQSAFAVGAIACLLRRHVSVSTGIMLVAALACAAASHTRWTQLANMLAIAYFVLWFSYVPRLPRVPHDWDLSYGIYLWAWPLQQAFVQAGVRDPFVLFAIVTPILLAVATVSWLGIERPALTLKDARWWRRNEVAPAGA
jgi:peptidoglycan/LPS O-acetylase OafA/YrhL